MNKSLLQITLTTLLTLITVATAQAQAKTDTVQQAKTYDDLAVTMLVGPEWAQEGSVW